MPPDRQPLSGRASQSSQRGFGLVSNCDGTGGVIVVGVFIEETLRFPPGDRESHAVDETRVSIAELCINLSGSIRDGLVHANRTALTVHEIVDELEQELGCVFTPVDLLDAASIVEQSALLGCKQSPNLLREIGRALNLFEHIERDPAAREERRAPAAVSVAEEKIDAARVRALLDRPEYADTWFFDSSDVDIPALQLLDSGARQRWFEESLERLASADLSERLEAMTEHMARWHRWRGELEEARLLRDLTRDLKRDWRSSTLVWGMLERTLVAHAELTRTAGATVRHCSNPAQRRRLRDLFFGRVESPTNEDLARLDFTEAAAATLDIIFEKYRPRQQPRIEERDAAAFSIGRAFADHLLGGGRLRFEATLERVTRSLGRACHLKPADQHHLRLLIVPTLHSYAQQICGQCERSCASHPQEDAGATFFEDSHPVLER